MKPLMLVWFISARLALPSGENRTCGVAKVSTETTLEEGGNGPELLQVEGVTQTSMPPAETCSEVGRGDIGHLRCIAGGSIGDDKPNFVSVKVLDKDGEPAAVKHALQQAQLSGHPVVLRHFSSKSTASVVQKTDAKHTMQKLHFNDREFKVRRFEPEHFGWAGMQKGDNGDRLKIAWAAGKPGLTDVSGDELVDLVRSNFTRGHYFHMQVKGEKRKEVLQAWGETGLLDDSRYPLFPGDTLAYSILFVQPQMLGGTHIDDLQGASYFHLSLFEGRKLIRMWPFFEHGELQTWGCLQEKWDTQKTPPELFLRGAYKDGFTGEHWGPRGFEYGFVTRHLFQNFRAENICNRLAAEHSRNEHAGRCFVEIELAAGEEIFVPSGIPHQVTSLEPCVALSSNYVFSPLSREGALQERIEEVLSATGMSSAFAVGDHKGLQRGDRTQKKWREALRKQDLWDLRKMILDSDQFSLPLWSQYERMHHPTGWLKVNDSDSTERWRVVTSVLLSLFEDAGATRS
eukprot:gnl/TRDRNA2_/TRDRNA2_176054_c0_seq3.p1 gnl/TRDRNA2_/TRDRNA2_176054_c0~~gnl/TRDRNA2_/TRDRNA2_176054_c0_seq3.p1  ORF type:complete len:515 (+),score=71.86 gnl/TRDRNA2_/TRDRNA2_176054_c0_seq3:115-1659(+)